MRFLALLCLFIPGITLAQSNFRSNGTGGGTWNLASTWQVESPNGSGTWIAASSTPTSASGTVQIRANDNVAVSANVTVDQVTVDATGTLTVNNGVVLTLNNGTGIDLSVLGTLQVDGSLTKTSGNHAFTFNGASIINNGTINLSVGTGTTTFSGANSSISTTGVPVATSFYSISINSGISVTASIPFTTAASSTLTVNGSLTTNSGFTASGAITVSGVSSSFTVNNSPFTVIGTLNVTNGGVFTTSVDATLSGNLSGTGTFTSSALTTFNGGTIISGSGSKTFANVIVTGSVSATTTISVTVNGNLTNNGIINFSGGTLIMSGTSNVIQTTGGAPTTTFFNLTISQSAVIDALTNFTLGNDLSVAGTLNATTNFDVVGDLTVASTGTLVADQSFSVGLISTINGVATAQAGFSTTTLTVSGASAVLTANNNPFSVDNNFTVSAGGDATANFGFDVQGNLSVTGSGSSLNISDVFSVAGSSDIDLAGVLIADASSQGTLAGNLLGTGAFTSNGEITFDGTTQISQGGVKSFNNILVTGTVTSTGTITINVAGNIQNDGTLNITTGTINLTGSNKTLSGANASIFNTTNITSSASITSSSAFTTNGILTVTGALVVNAGVTAIGNVTIAATTGSLIVNNSPFSIGGTLTVNGILTANAGANLTLTSVTGTNFTVNTTGNFTSLANVIFDGITTMGANGSRVFRDMQINSGRTLLNTGSVGFSVTNSIINNNGTINLAAGTSSTVTFTQNASIAGLGAPTTTFFNLIVAASQTLSISTFPAASAITIASDLTLNGNLDHTATNIISIADDILGTTGTLSSAGTIQFNGTASAFVTGGSTKTLTNLTVAGTNGVLSINANSLSIDGVLTVNSGCTLNAGTGATGITFGNNFAGTTPSIAGTGNINFRSLIVATGHTLTSSSGIISLTLNFTNNGSFVHNSGTVRFQTDGAKTITGNSTTFNNIEVGNGTGNTTVTNSLSPLNLRGRLTLNTAVVNTFNTGNNLVLLSTSDNPATDGSIGPLVGTATAVVSGLYTAQRFMSNENRLWRYISAPVSGATVAQLKNAFPVSGNFTDPTTIAECGSCPGYNPAATSLNFYKETTTAGYIAYPTAGTSSASALLQVGRGYSAYVRQDGLPGPATINFQGTHPSTSGVTLPVPNFAEGSALIGNPYPSPIIWDPNNSTLYPGTAGIYATAKIRNNGTGGPAFVDVNPGDVIAVGQAFWVFSSSASASLTISENAKTSSSSANFYRTSEAENDQLVITLTKPSSGMTDKATVRVQPGSLAGYDNFDSFKWDGRIQSTSAPLGINVFDVSTVSPDNISLSTNALPSLSCSQQINLKIADLLYDPSGASEASANYTIGFEQSGAFKNLVWTLHDKAANNGAGSDIDVSNGNTYSFTVNNAVPETKATDRFYLTIAPSESVNASLTLTAISNTCDGAGSTVTITGSQAGVTYGAEINGVVYSNLIQGNGENVLIDLEDEWLVQGDNLVKVIANNGCDLQYLSTTLTVKKNPNYKISTAIGATICKPQSVQLNASSAENDAMFKWYLAENGGESIGTGAQFNTPVVNTSTTYYAAAVSPSGCEGARTAVEIVINDGASEIEVSRSADVVCKGRTVTFTATSTLIGGNFKWYESSTSATPIISGSDFTTPSLLTNSKYYVSYESEQGCESSRIEVAVEVSDFTPTISGVTEKAIACVGSEHTLIALGAPKGSSYQWYESATSTTPLAVASEWGTPSLNESRVYYLSSSNELGCESARVAVAAKIDLSDASAKITASNKIACQNENVDITISGVDNAIYRWYSSKTDVFPLAEGTTTTWDKLGYVPTYYVSAINDNGCEGTRKEIKMNVITHADARIDSLADGKLISNFDSENYWYLNDKFISNERIVNAEADGTYTLKVIVSGKCETTTARVNQINLTTGVGESFDESYQIYPNPVTDYLRILINNPDRLEPQLFDISGRLISKINMADQGNNQWLGQEDLSSLVSGIYLIKIKTKSSIVVRKIIVK